MDADTINTIENYFLLYLVSGVVVIGTFTIVFRTPGWWRWYKEQRRWDQILSRPDLKKPAIETIKEIADGALVASGTLLLWPFVLAAVFYEEYFKPEPSYEVDPFDCKLEHLRLKITPEEAEAKSFITDPKGRVPAKPFGHLNAGWQKFLAEEQPQYELWTFHIEGRPPHTTSDLPWVQLRDQKEGLTWVHDGKVRAEFFTAWSGD